MKLNFTSLLAIILLCLLNTKMYSQSNFNIDRLWDNYYNTNPSGIENNYSASDYINVIEKVNFIPVRKELNGSSQLLKRVLLTLGADSLRQMMITGNYYSRTIKHNDYFNLYNMTYSQINKDTWNKLCPYLIPLMDLDGTLNLKYID